MPDEVPSEVIEEFMEALDVEAERWLEKATEEIESEES
jgi:hypothetical protein